ncbi:MAG: HAMP domain-containing histidine kinase [Myxococcota bacterium]|nr:HAMP domain-containing histidine kinase [Myxococcota bacterium]
MRLSSRLIVSHAAPVVVVSLALALVLAAIGRMTQLVGELGEEELRTLASEGALHQTAWNVDLAMRHALSRCARGERDEARDHLQRNDALLRAQLGRSAGVSEGLRRASEGYTALAGQMLEAGVCSEHAAAAELQRGELDALITTMWVERLAELHASAREQEEQARRLGSSALWTGVPIAAVALALAMLIARRMAAEISDPLATISKMARRLSHGDFGERITAAGPVEVVELAEELEQMRARLAELESLKQGFLASVSHELRTPLSKIREALALLSDGACGPLEDRQVRVVAIARTACEREIRLVSTLLDLSRLRAGSPLRRRNASFDDTLDAALEEEEPDAKAKRVTIELEREGDTPRAVLDDAMIERALANLVRNAVSVSRAGQRVRVVRSLERTDGRPFAVVRVSDEGPGVPPEVREMLFEPFVTVAVPSSPKALGVGLGLALSREVARAHGGDLELDQAVASGACFVLRVPLDAGDSTAPPRPIKSSTEVST